MAQGAGTQTGARKVARMAGKPAGSLVEQPRPELKKRGGSGYWRENWPCQLVGWKLRVSLSFQLAQVGGRWCHPPREETWWGRGEDKAH